MLSFSSVHGLGLRAAAVAVVVVAVLPFASCLPEEGFWSDDPPRTAKDEPCSDAEPNGTCHDGQTCRAGQCLDDALFCSADNDTGLCADKDDACLEGSCVPATDLCSATNTDGLCSSGLACREGVCATDQPCAPTEPQGFCDSGNACITGVCHPLEDLCSTTNPGGLCELGKTCVEGACVDASQACGCTDTQTCIDGVCRDPGQLCGVDNPSGVCADGASCIAGSCEDLGAACSPQNQTGVCAPGSLCEQGTCVVLDGAALCNDNNPCTVDAFDPIRNRCRNDARDGSCDDGNACTNDTCVEGQCTGTAVGGCIEPPSVDPIASPTNVGTLTIRGAKPAGASVKINNQEAISENPDATWQVSVNLVPGDNVYVIQSVDGATASATREIHVVYDITAPTTRVTPDGGSFLSGVTATLASSEPATIFFTTDGSDPTETSTFFASLKQLRIFSDTHLRLRARDLAGNLEADIVDVEFQVSGRGSAWQDGPLLAEAISLAGVTARGGEIVVAGGTDGLAPQAGAFSYNLDSETFTSLPSLSGARDSLALVTLNDVVYAVGGQNAGTPLNRVEALAASATAWELKAAMPSTRHSLAAVAEGGKIYVLGGMSNGGAVLNNVEVYDPTANSWSNAVAQMPRARAGFGAVVINGLIYAVGGANADGEPVAELDVYDPGTDSWTTLAPLPTPRSYLGVTTVLNRGAITSGRQGIVAAGGLALGGDASAVVEEYILEDNAWVPRAPLPAARHSSAAVTVDVTGDVDEAESQGWLIGGQEGTRIVKSTRALRTDLDYTRRLPDMPAGRFLHAAASLDDRIYLFGGRDFSEETEGWAFDPETGSYEDLPALPSVQNGLGAASVGDRVYAIGGANGFGVAVPTLRAYDPAERAWVELAPMTSARSDVATAVMGTDVYVIGGENGGALQTVEIYDVARNSWRAGPLLPGPRKGAMAATYQGKVHVFGGEDAAGAPVSAVLRLDDGSWTALAGAVTVSYGAAFTLQDKVAIFAGRTNGVIADDIVEYDLLAQTVLPGRNPAQRLHPVADRRAATLHNGRLFLFGGNESAALGPSGTSRVDEVDARCFNGVRDGREGPAVDSFGGCPDAGFVHHTGFPGETFVNTTPNSTTTLQAALDACNAHFGGNTCQQACGSSCLTVTQHGQCSCNEAFVWSFGNSGCFSTDTAGRVSSNSNGSCTGTFVGNWD